jgi:Xaa-Pro aminopeptidase
MQDSYANRRQQALDAIHPGVLIVPSAPTVLRNGDVPHEYRQDSDFYYLTGFEEPGSVLVLMSPAEHHFTLFLRPRDPEREAWDGPRAGLEGATRDLGAEQAWPHEELVARLPDLLRNRSRLFYRFGRDRALDDAILSTIAVLRTQGRKGVWWPREFVDPESVLHELRVTKTPGELELVRRAVAITNEAVLLAMAEARPGRHEYEIEALVRGTFLRLGAERVAFAPTVASGPNATVLHYRKNDRLLAPGELLLLDVGCEYRYYASDVTRTFPVSGTFSRPQASLYRLVLRAQEAALARVGPGCTLEQVHQAALLAITEGLVELGLVQGPVADALEERRYQPFFMHRTSHYLGMDVHDVGLYHFEGTPRPLEPGMLITIEPGVYVAENADVPAEYRGIGVRIEDDVLVTEAGREVLSAGIPKDLADVERVCRRS